jgi:hypothetical protein
MNEGMNYLWPTKVQYNKIKDSDILDPVVQEIFNMYDLNNPPNDFANNNGLFEKCGPELTKFKTDIVIPTFENYLNTAHNASLKEYKSFKLKAWITGTGNGYNMVYHNHSGAAFSAVFYLLAEEKQAGGSIVFSDPRSNCNRGYDSNLSKEFENIFHLPSTGDVLVFPSFLYHYVNPYYSKFRIAMPVDLFIHFG